MKRKKTTKEAKQIQKDRKKHVAKWDDSFYVRAYQCAKSGENNETIARSLGIKFSQFKTWVSRNLALHRAIEEGRAASKQKISQTYQNYVYQSLPPKLKRVWDEIAVYLEHNAVERIERLLRDRGDRERQSLFIHALVSYNFDPSRALKAVCCSVKQLNRWKEDPDFAELLQEMDYHKTNFIEGALMDAVERGEGWAITLAAKNYIRSKFGDKSEVHHTGTVEHKRTYSIAELEAIPLEDRKRLLDSIRETRQAQLQAPRTAEVVEVKNGGK